MAARMPRSSSFFLPSSVSLCLRINPSFSSFLSLFLWKFLRFVVLTAPPRPFLFSPLPPSSIPRNHNNTSGTDRQKMIQAGAVGSAETLLSVGLCRRILVKNTRTIWLKWMYCTWDECCPRFAVNSNWVVAPMCPALPAWVIESRKRERTKCTYCTGTGFSIAKFAFSFRDLGQLQLFRLSSYVLSANGSCRAI